MLDLLINDLEKANPYWFEKDRNEYAKHGNMVWGDCCAKLRELIASQPPAPSVGVLIEALDNLVNAIPNENEHQDWWPDGLRKAMDEAILIVEQSSQTPSNTEGQEEQQQLWLSVFEYLDKWSRSMKGSEETKPKIKELIQQYTLIKK